MIFFLKFNKIILELIWGRTSSKNNIHPCVFIRVQLFAAPWTGAHQAPLSMGFPRQEYWSGLSFHSPGIFLTQLMSSILAGRFFITEPQGKPKGGISPIQTP